MTQGDRVQDKAFGNLLCCLILVKVVAVLWLFYAFQEQNKMLSFLKYTR